jgi:hypothetical protein
MQDSFVLNALATTSKPTLEKAMLYINEFVTTNNHDDLELISELQAFLGRPNAKPLTDFILEQDADSRKLTLQDLLSDYERLWLKPLIDSLYNADVIRMTIGTEPDKLEIFFAGSSSAQVQPDTPLYLWSHIFNETTNPLASPTFDGLFVHLQEPFMPPRSGTSHFIDSVKVAAKQSENPPF